MRSVALHSLHLAPGIPGSSPVKSDSLLQGRAANIPSLNVGSAAFMHPVQSLGRQYNERLSQAVRHFQDHVAFKNHTGLMDRIHAFKNDPCLRTARELVAEYAPLHRRGDLEPLRWITSVFSDKAVVLRLVESILSDERALAEIASQSYPHPIGFDKLVLYSDPVTGFKLRLHIYWRSPQQLKQELTHLHRFEMASSPITGELTNIEYAVTSSSGDIPIATEPPVEGRTQLLLQAYTGYEKGPNGIYRKRLCGEVNLQEVSVVTYVCGQTYVMPLDHAHYVVTNAETGHYNGDICSTIMIHGGALTDAAGRSLPILFEGEKVDDTNVAPIKNYDVATLKKHLERYRDQLRESLKFYGWVFDPKYGRNLLVGMVAGYILARAFGNKNVMQQWNASRPACEAVLQKAQKKLLQLIQKELRIESLDGKGRFTRYYQILLNQSYSHPDGQMAWFEESGDLLREFERYAGAMIGDYLRNQNAEVFKPVWLLPNTILPGGAHYGHIKAMLDATKETDLILRNSFQNGGYRIFEEEAREFFTTELDRDIENRIKRHLMQQFPQNGFWGEETGKSDAPTHEGDTRWVVDPIDGTRNFAHGDRNFGTSIAHEVYQNGAWNLTDGVLSMPVQNCKFWAEQGQGAFYIDETGKETKLVIPEMPVKIPGSFVEVSLRGLGEKEYPLYKKLDDLGVVRRQSGCAAHGIAMVASGARQAAIITANHYDVAAALLIAKEAGAKIKTQTIKRDGQNFTVYIVAQNQTLLDTLENSLDAVLQAST